MSPVGGEVGLNQRDVKPPLTPRKVEDLSAGPVIGSSDAMDLAGQPLTLTYERREQERLEVEVHQTVCLAMRAVGAELQVEHGGVALYRGEERRGISITVASDQAASCERMVSEVRIEAGERLFVVQGGQAEAAAVREAIVAVLIGPIGQGLALQAVLEGSQGELQVEGLSAMGAGRPGLDSVAERRAVDGCKQAIPIADRQVARGAWEDGGARGSDQEPVKQGDGDGARGPGDEALIPAT